jgi:hypothetical protein
VDPAEPLPDELSPGLLPVELAGTGKSVTGCTGEVEVELEADPPDAFKRLDRRLL